MLDIGLCKAHRTFMFCPACNQGYPAEDFYQSVPPCSNIGYDVMAFIGQLIFSEHHTINEVHLKLKARNVHISYSEVAYLAQRFIIYLSVVHFKNSARLKNQIQKNGGYILHIDGTCDGGSPHLVSAIDEVSNFVLANVKVPSEKKDQLLPFLQKIKEQYGLPLAVSTDMGTGILASVSEVFPDTPNFICHFHFLRDIGKDLLDKQYALIRKKLKKFKVSSKLRYRLRYSFDVEAQGIKLHEIYQIVQNSKAASISEREQIQQLSYVLLLWALDGKKQGNGFGFPFDRPHAEFYRRLCLLYEQLSSLLEKIPENNPSMFKIIAKVVDDISPLVNDTECMKAYQVLTKKQIVFDELRQSLAITLPGTKQGLNDNGQDLSMDTIKERVKVFKNNLLKVRGYHKSRGYQSLMKQIEKYWGKLFCDPIKVSTSKGDYFIQPQRTNNISEQFFRGLRRSHRKATGNNSMCKKLQSMNADTPLVKNLNNPKYMEIISNGGKSLTEIFAKINQKEIMEKMNEHKKDESKIPPKVLMLVRDTKAMQKLLYLTAC